MEYLKCPYCGEDLDTDNLDDSIFDVDELHTVECGNCCKRFVFSTVVNFLFFPKKADCLNGGNHNYQLTHTIPRELSNMRCSECKNERELTHDERIEFKIGTIKDYLESLKNINHG